MTDQEPVTITDKRARKRQEDAEALAAQLEPETVDDALARVDRMEELLKKGTLSAANGGPELTEDERTELLALQVREDMERDKAEQAEGDLIPALTAFLVIVGHDGSARATSDVNTNLVIDREATVDDMFAGASIVVRDINAATNSKHVVFGLSVSAQAMQEKQQRTAVMSKLHPSTSRNR